MRRSMLYISCLLFTVLNAQSPPLTVNAFFEHESCSNGTGYVDLSVSGGTPPYTYNWSNGASSQDISMLSAGSYSVTVKDMVLDSVVRNYIIIDQPFLELSIYDYPAQDGHANCPGSCWGQFRVILPPNLTQPVSFSEPSIGTDQFGHPFFLAPGGACTGDIYVITVTDGNGCSGDITVGISGAQVNDPFMYITDTQGSCTSTFDGSITVTNVYDGNFYTNPELRILDAGYNLIFTVDNASNTQVVNALAPGDYILSRQWWGVGGWYQYTAYDCGLDDLPFTIPDLGSACGTLSGKVFIDNDQDCVQDPAEVSVPYQVLEILPGPEYTISNSDGSYSRALTNGNYTIGQNNPTLIPICPLPQPYAFTMNNLPVNIEFADSSTVPLDLVAQRAASAARPGFTTHHYLKVTNLSPQVSGMVTVQHVHDPILVYTSASPTPNTISGDTLTWTFSQINAYGQKSISVQYDVPIPTPLGTPLSSVVSVENTLSDADLSNNVKTINQTVTGSYDPNDKLVQTSTGWSESEYYIGDDQWLDYTILFQNTGTDTAFTVVISDTLETDLDMATFEQGVASHDFTVMFHTDNVVEWTFDNILLPDSGTNEAASHGLVSFRIWPSLPVLPGTELSNIADIFFDLNAPIRTNDALLIAATSTDIQQAVIEEFLVFPNPTNDLVNVQLTANSVIRSIQLLDISGRVLLERQPGNVQNAALSLNGRASGLYLIRVESAEGAVYMSSISLEQ